MRRLLIGTIADEVRVTEDALAGAERLRVPAPAIESVEQLHEWQRDRTVGGVDRVVELRGAALETLIYSLPPLTVITPFGRVTLVKEPDGP